MIKVGADPEFEIRDSSGNHVSANRYFSGLDNQLGTDGNFNTGEIRPSFGLPTTVNRSVSSLISQMAKKTQYEAYAGAGKHVALGGHIHFSGIQNSPELLQKLDQFIAIPLNEVSNSQIRTSERYGNLSEFKHQTHGWEYRSPVSWLSHPWIAKGAIVIAYYLARAQEKGKLNQITDRKSLTLYVTEMGKGTDSRIHAKNFYKAIENLKKSGHKLEEVKIFQAWKKRPRTDTQTQTRRQINFRFSMSDDNMTEIAQQFESNNGAQIRIIGAGQHRTPQQEEVIFLSHTMIQSFINIQSILIREWELNDVGLSVSLRRNTEKCVRILNQLKEALENQIQPTENNFDALKALEGKSYKEN